MSAVDRIRKQVHELTAEDLNKHPLWQFCPEEEGEEGQDEATVRPSDDHEVPGHSPGVYILACDVRFADGSTAPGYIYSGKQDDFGCTQPNVITVSGQVNFWVGWLRFVKDPAVPIAAAMARLNKGAASIFPVQFHTRPNISGARMEVIVRGFMAKGVDQKLTEPTCVIVNS